MADPDLELGRMGKEWGERGRVGGVVLLAPPCFLPSMIFFFNIFSIFIYLPHYNNYKKMPKKK